MRTCNTFSTGEMLSPYFDMYNVISYLVSDPFFLCYKPILDYFLPNTYIMTLFMFTRGNWWFKACLFNFLEIIRLKCFILYSPNGLTHEKTIQYLCHSGTTSHCAIRYQIHSGTQGSFDMVLSAPNPFRYRVMHYSGTVCSVPILVLRFVTVCISIPKPLFLECTSWTSMMTNISRRQLNQRF